MRNKKLDLGYSIYIEVSNAINQGLTLAEVISEIKKVCETAHENNPKWHWDQDAKLIASIIPKISN